MTTLSHILELHREAERLNGAPYSERCALLGRQEWKRLNDEIRENLATDWCSPFPRGVSQVLDVPDVGRLEMFYSGFAIFVDWRKASALSFIGRPNSSMMEAISIANAGVA